jgi:hypothetical protein
MARQVAQVKRKNSTNCNPPEARLTVVGSVASRFGPREVARGTAVAASLGTACAPESSVEAARVTVGRISAGSPVPEAGGVVGEDPGEHPANRAMLRMRLRKNRFFIIFLRKGYSTKSLRKDYKDTLRLRSTQGEHIFDVREILRYTVFSPLVT